MKIKFKTRPAFKDELDQRIDAVDEGGVCFDNVVQNTTSEAIGHLGVIAVTVKSTTTGAISLSDTDTFYIDIDEARELIDALQEAVLEAEEM